MAAPPLTFLENKWAANSTSNFLIQAATQTADRKNVPMLDRDVVRNISTVGRRILMSLGRHLSMNVPQVRGMVMERANLISTGIISQYYGDNEEFKTKAEDWILEHNKICDVRGWPYSMDTFYRNLVISQLRDGGQACLFTETPNGYPLIQVIPVHRIGSMPGVQKVDGYFYGHEIGTKKPMQFEGWMRDGIIFSDSGQTIGYNVSLTDLVSSWSECVKVSSSDMMLNFIPEFPEQIREISEIGLAAFDWQDISEWRRFEMMAQKIGSGIALQEFNEAGEPPPGSDLSFTTPPTSGETTTGTPSGLYTETIDGGMIRYFRAKNGGKLEAFQNDRPSGNQQSFEDKVARAAMHGASWSMDFSLDPSKVGGAPMRVVVEKINRSIEVVQKLLIEPAARRLDGWRISKAINLGLLPAVDDWWKWEHQFPANVTADKKYDSDVDVQELRSGLQAPQDAIGRRGQYWEDVQDKAIAFQKRFQDKCAAAGVDPEKIIWPTPNGPQPEPAQASDSTDTSK
jgi:hypothetical protein